MPALVVVALAAVKVVGEVRVRGARSVLDAHRAHVAVWAVIVGGYLALLTSANSGIWFALPLEVLGVGAVVALAPALAPSPRRVAGTVVVAVALLNLVAVGNWPVGARHAFDAGEQQGSLAAVLFGDMYQPPTGLRTNDPLLLSERNDREAVGAQWWAAHARVADAIEAERSGDGLVHQTVTGSGQLMNANSIDLAQELSQRPATSWDAVDSTASDLSPWLTPSVGRSPRVLVVIELDSGVFPIDEQWREVVDEAVAQGWTETARVPLPDGGSVSVLSHPDAGPG